MFQSALNLSLTRKKGKETLPHPLKITFHCLRAPNLCSTCPDKCKLGTVWRLFAGWSEISRTFPCPTVKAWLYQHLKRSNCKTKSLNLNGIHQFPQKEQNGGRYRSLRAVLHSPLSEYKLLHKRPENKLFIIFVVLLSLVTRSLSFISSFSCDSYIKIVKNIFFVCAMDHNGVFYHMQKTTIMSLYYFLVGTRTNMSI